MLKVLQIIYGINIGGAETFLYNLLRVTDSKEVSFDFAIQDGNTKNKKLIRLIAEKRGHIYIIPKFPWHIFSQYNSIRRIIKKEKYDLIHYHINSLVNIIPILATVFCHVKCVVHSHNTKTKSKLGFLLHQVNRILVSVLPIEACACSYVAGRWAFGEKKYTVLPNSIDVNDFYISNEDKQKFKLQNDISDKKILLTVSRLSKEKNILFLLPIIEKLVQSHKNLIMYVVGDGEEKDKIETYIKSHGLVEYINLEGSQENTAKYYKLADVFLMPSLYEGLPISLLEAQASGIAAVVSNNISIECIVCENTIQLPLDAYLWEKTIREIINLKYSRFEQKNALKVKEAGFGLSNLKKKIMELYPQT